MSETQIKVLMEKSKKREHLIKVYFWSAEIINLQRAISRSKSNRRARAIERTRATREVRSESLYRFWCEDEYWLSYCSAKKFVQSWLVEREKRAFKFIFDQRKNNKSSARDISLEIEPQNACARANKSNARSLFRIAASFLMRRRVLVQLLLGKEREREREKREIY